MFKTRYSSLGLKWLLFLFVFLFSLKSSQAQGNPPDNITYLFDIVGQIKTCYSLGDTVHLCLTAIQGGRVCTDGVERTRLLGRGINIISQHSWQENQRGRYTKQFSIVVTGNKTMALQVTAYRKTDKGEIARTLTLKSTAKQ